MVSQQYLNAGLSAKDNQNTSPNRNSKNIQEMSTSPFNFQSASNDQLSPSSNLNSPSSNSRPILHSRSPSHQNPTIPGLNQNHQHHYNPINSANSSTNPNSLTNWTALIPPMPAYPQATYKSELSHDQSIQRPLSASSSSRSNFHSLHNSKPDNKIFSSPDLVIPFNGVKKNNPFNYNNNNNNNGNGNVPPPPIAPQFLTKPNQRHSIAISPISSKKNLLEDEIIQQPIPIKSRSKSNSPNNLYSSNSSPSSNINNDQRNSALKSNSPSKINNHPSKNLNSTPFAFQPDNLSNPTLHDQLRSPPQQSKPHLLHQHSQAAQIHRPNLNDNNNSIINQNNIPTNNTNNNQLINKKSMRKKKKVCKCCGLEITGQFVRALSNAFHVDCFRCDECGEQCSAKFFPHDKIDESTGLKYQVALCEYDYFKKLDLICFNCNSALRGPYITALGNKYHLEHFRCAVCEKVFESDESYYEHEGNIYCHFHYSKLYASHCEGCHSSIVKQFVELFRGGRNQQWHPECYMVHKFWNVCITADSVGLETQFNVKSIENLNLQDSNIEPNVLIAMEEQIENTVMSCWLTLSGYEENTAACISDMLLNACTGNQASGLFATGKLILNVEVLFQAIDTVQDFCNIVDRDMGFNKENSDGRNNSNTSNDNDIFQPLRKEPRNISGKIMSYLAILRKSGQISSSGSLSAELLSVITGCAHYLKLLIRIGLNNALKVNKIRGTTEATDNFLIATKNYEELGSDPESLNQLLMIHPNATDSCQSCLKSIERSCIEFDNKRWHVKCFECSNCKTGVSSIDTSNHVKKFTYDKNKSLVFCENCTNDDAVPGFLFASDLSQLIYLLKIALYRSKSVMISENGSSKIQSNQPIQPSISNHTPRSNLAEQRDAARVVTENDYSKTLNDVTRLRSRRQSQKLSSSIKKKARKSVVVEAPEADKAKEEVTNDDGLVEDAENNLDHGLQFQNRKGNHMSFIAQQHDHDIFKVKERNIKDPYKKSLKIRDEPQRQLTNSHLDRTSDLLKNEKSLTLDDIPRIVAAEQAREQRPNAFKHHNTLYQRNRPMQPVKTVAAATGGKTPTTSTTDDKGNVVGTSVDTSQVKKSKYYSELSKPEHYVLRHIAIEALLEICPNKHNKEELLNLIQLPKKLSGGFWDKFKFGANDQKNKGSSVFGIDLQDLTKKFGVDSDLGVGPSKLRIPIVVDDVINALRQKDMSVEGIFRLNGNIKKLRELTEQINKNPLKSPDFTGQNAVQLAALMKKWLRELPNPLLTFGLYDLWISSQREKDPAMQKRILQLTYCLLPRSHRNLVEVLLYFFSWVASFAEIDEETGSKMDIHNLATVISPNILYSKQSVESDQAPQSGETYFLGIEVVNQLIEIHEELSVIPVDLLQFLEKCGVNPKSESMLNSKDIMSKIDKLIKENPKPFSNFEVKIDSEVPHHTNTIKRGQTRVLTESHGETTNV